MKGSELKKISESLGRFANVRESAKFPTDRLFVQAANGVVKVVAMAPYGTLVSEIHETDEKFRAIVKSRDFLTQCKALTAKQEVEITQAKEGWQNGIMLGDVYLESISHDLPTGIYMAPKNPQYGGHVEFTADEIDELARMVDGIGPDYEWDHVQFAGAIYTNDSSHIRVAVSDNYRWATREFTGNYEVFGTLEGSFVSNLRGIGDCRLKFDPASSTCVVSSGRHTAIGKYNFLTYRVPLDGPAITKEKPDNLAVVDRSELLKQLRLNEKFDKHSRIGLNYDAGTVKVVPFEESNHGWGLNARLLIGLLMATSAKKVGLGLRTGKGRAINVRVPDWTIELAPLGRSQKKKSIATRSTIPPGIYAG